MRHSSDVHKIEMSDGGMTLVPMDADATAGGQQKMKLGKAISDPNA